MEQRQLEPGGAWLRDAADAVTERIVGFLSELDARSAGDPALGAKLVPDLLAPPAEEPGLLEPLLDRVMAAAETSAESAGPGYLCHIPGGGLLSAALADYLSLALNRYTGLAGLAPAMVALEQGAVDWMCRLFRLPSSAQGVLLSGGSMANLTAIAAARHRHAEGSTDRAVVYVGEHAHASVLKAARTVGIARNRVRIVPSDDRLRMIPEAVAEQVRADRRAGLRPVCVVAAAGTTNTGTIDPLNELATVAADAGTWFHVDAAYGGFFQLTDRGRLRLGGIERADSITLDPHKSLFFPFGTGALLVRDRGDLRRAFGEDAEYLRDLDDDTGLPDFNDLGPELSRDARGLRVWLPLHLHGVSAFRAALDEKLDLTEAAHRRLVDDPHLEVPWRPHLSILPFRLAGGDDAANQRLLDRINATQRVLLSSTCVDGRLVLRLAILAHRTHADRVEEALDLIAAAARGLAAA